MADQKLNCEGEGFRLSANLSGYQMSNMTFFVKSSQILASDSVTYRKSQDQFSSQRFDPYIEYPIYKLSNMFYLSLPGGDMREGNFVGLLHFAKEEVVLECQTKRSL